jgi:hypothetical protein
MNGIMGKNMCRLNYTLTFLLQTFKSYLKIQSVSVITNESTLHSEKTAVYSEVRTKHVNALCGQKMEFLNVKSGVLGFFAPFDAWHRIRKI